MAGHLATGAHARAHTTAPHTAPRAYASRRPESGVAACGHARYTPGCKKTGGFEGGSKPRCVLRLLCVDLDLGHKELFSCICTP